MFLIEQYRIRHIAINVHNLGSYDFKFDGNFVL